MKAVVLAAGEGKRLRPLTHTRPKCMIPIAGKPILEHVVNELRAAGLRDIVMVVRYMKEKVMDYFGDGKEFGVKIEYAVQGERYGTGAAFAAARELVDDEFVGIAGDVITEASAIRRLVRQAEGTVTMGLKRVENPSKYGVVLMRGDRVVDFEEKPEKPKSELANTSIYVFGKRAMEELGRAPKTERGEYEITGVLRRLAKSGEVKGVEISEFWMDVGLPWQFLTASEHIINRMPARRKGSVSSSELVGKVIVEKGADIFNSYIEGPAYIGEKAEIGPFAYIRPTTSIGAHCSLSSGTTVKNSILMDGVKAKHLTYIGDSIIGEGCNFGAGTQVANYRFDAKTVKMRLADRKYDTETTKFGVVMGDNVKTGVLSCVMPGKSIGDGCWIGSGVVVHEDVPRRTKVFVRQTLEFIHENMSTERKVVE